MCLYPKLIKNPKYKINKKNGGVIPPISDKRIELVPIGCGKCMECLKKKAREWQIRMSEEIKNDKSGKFITLTFNEKSLKELTKIAKKEINESPKRKPIIENYIAKIAVRRFLERWRKKYKKSIKHWLVTEVGHENTERIHMHGILFTDVPRETIEEIWKYGIIWIGEYVNAETGEILMIPKHMVTEFEIKTIEITYKYGNKYITKTARPSRQKRIPF